MKEMRETEGGELIKSFEENENLLGEQKIKRKFLLISILSILTLSQSK